MTIGENAGGKEDVETKIMDLIVDAWGKTLEGKPDVFQHRVFGGKMCFIVYKFNIHEKKNGFEKGMFIPATDFFADLGMVPYQSYEGTEYTYLDYVQDSPSGFPGRIDVFPSASRDNDQFCYEGKRKLSDTECEAKRNAVGFYPNGAYAIAVVSGQRSLKFLQPPATKNNYVIIDDASNIEGLCEVVT
jgi:hypothetical protein